MSDWIMSCTRNETLQALRHWGNPVASGTLAAWMNRSPSSVRNNLRDLYSRDLVDRNPDPIYQHRYLYRPKVVVA